MTATPDPTRRLTARNALSAALACAAVLTADQLSKYLVVEAMNLRETGEIAIFPGLAFRMAWNTGVNFGLLSDGGDAARFALSVGALLIASALLVGSLFARRMPTAIGLGLAAGGAAGNAIDRLNWGAVADFLNVSCCGIRNPWSFNVADIAVFAGFALLLLPLRRPPQAPTA
jgi:signal peptidase II